jgi:hypothetical protein
VTRVKCGMKIFVLPIVIKIKGSKDSSCQDIRQ